MNVMVRDLDLSQVSGVAEGLSLFGGAQLAIDATLVSALRGDGTARVGAHTPGAAFKPQEGRRRGRTLSWRVKGGVPDSLSSLVRSEDGGLLKQRSSSHH